MRRIAATGMPVLYQQRDKLLPWRKAIHGIVATIGAHRQVIGYRPKGANTPWQIRTNLSDSVFDLGGGHGLCQPIKLRESTIPLVESDRQLAGCQQMGHDSQGRQPKGCHSSQRGVLVNVSRNTGGCSKQGDEFNGELQSPEESLIGGVVVNAVPNLKGGLIVFLCRDAHVLLLVLVVAARAWAYVAPVRDGRIHQMTSREFLSEIALVEPGYYIRVSAKGTPTHFASEAA